MLFSKCTFDNTVIIGDIPEARYEECVFIVDSEEMLPAIWQCLDCTVVLPNREIFIYGQSTN